MAGDEISFLRGTPSQFLRREHDLVHQFMAPLRPVQQQLAHAMHRYEGSTDLESPAEVVDGWMYFTRLDPGSESKVFCRRRVSDSSQCTGGGRGGGCEGEEVILDLNTIFPTARYLCLGRLVVSHDHKYLAFTLDETGDETFGAYVKNLHTGELEHHIENANCIEWANTAGPRALYYTSVDDVLRPSTVHRLRFHDTHSSEVATPAPKTELVHAEADGAFYLSLKKTKDGRYLSVCANSKTTAEIWLLDADADDDPAAPAAAPSLHLVQQRVPGLEYYLDHCNGRLFILHNGGASGADNFDLATVAAPASGHQEKEPQGRAHWRCVVAGTDDRLIDDMDVFDDHCVLYTRFRGAPQIGVISGLRAGRALDAEVPAGRAQQVSTAPGAAAGAGAGAGATAGVRYCVDFPTSSEALLVQPGVNAAFRAHELHFSTQSPLDPPQHFRLDLHTLSIHPVTPGAAATSGHGDAAVSVGSLQQRFRCCMVHAASHDGVEVPMTLVHRSDLALDGANPVLLRGYGAYGDWLRPEYEPDVLPLLDQGWVLATAHVRGGGFLGRRWYRDGRQMKKWNSFHDFLACADFLVQRGYTRPDRLAAEGASAGGLLVATAASVRPDLFSALSLRAPFVDVVSAMTDATRPLTVHEYDEWGNPNNGPGSEDILAYLESYCPTHRLKQQLKEARGAGTALLPAPPAVLITMAADDPRVDFGEVAQYAALLREARDLAARPPHAPARPVLLHTHGVRGHGGGGRYEHYLERAFTYSFLQRTMGLALCDR